MMNNDFQCLNIIAGTSSAGGLVFIYVIHQIHSCNTVQNNMTQSSNFKYGPTGMTISCCVLEPAFFQRSFIFLVFSSFYSYLNQESPVILFRLENEVPPRLSGFKNERINV